MNGRGHGNPSTVTRKGGDAIPSSSPPAPFLSLEQRIEKLEALVADLRCIEDKSIYTDEAEFKASIRELARGNKKALERYIKKGGKIPVDGKV